MLNFRNTNLLFAGLLILLIVLHACFSMPYFVYALLLFTYSLIVFYGCVNIASGFFLPVTCKANPSGNEIAISFDDGPANEHTAEILQVLEKENVKAAFFCIGNRIPGNERLLKKIIDHGHIIGNHSYSHHFWFDLFSPAKMLKDMRMMDEAMKAVTGLQPKLFRPPYGVTNPNLKKAIIRGNYIPVGWSVRSMDTVTKDEHKLLNHVMAGLKPGAVFLFHDTCESTFKMLPTFIKEVKKRGYQFVPLDKLLHLTPYA